MRGGISRPKETAITRFMLGVGVNVVKVSITWVGRERVWDAFLISTAPY